MGPASPGADEAEWVRRAGALTAEREHDSNGSNGDRINAALAEAGRLVALARALADQGRCHGCATESTGCRLGAGHGRRAACALARDLAVSGPPIPSPPVPAADVARVYIEALAAAGDAVYYCRRVSHRSNCCWFSAQGPAHDLCGRILATAHDLRGSNGVRTPGRRP